jgi:hypothetical protein
MSCVDDSREITPPLIESKLARWGHTEKKTQQLLAADDEQGCESLLPALFFFSFFFSFLWEVPTS